MWNTNAGSGNSGSKEAFIHEGNVDFLVIGEEKLRVTPLTEKVDIEQLMSNLQMTREQAMEHLYTAIAEERWVNPKAFWEHSIPSIPNVRFFSTIPCQGRQSCPCCAENQIAENNGVTENKNKPFPVRKKFMVPVWVYSLNRVLFIRQNEKFINQMGEYINQFGPEIEFDIWRTGKGFSTEYHVMYVGQRSQQLPQMQFLMPNQIDLTVDIAEIDKRIGNSSASAQSRPPQAQSFQQFSDQVQGASQGSPGTHQSQQGQTMQNQNQMPIQGQPMGQAAPTGQVNEPAVGTYNLPFGNYKGQSLEAVYQSGDVEYLKFLATQGAGLVKNKVDEFLKLKGELQ